MRILMVTEDYHGSPFGGIPRVLSETCSRLRAMGDEVVVLMPRLPADLPARETVAGVDVVRYSCSTAGGLGRLLSSYRSSKALARQIHEEDAFDVVHGHFYLSALGAFDSAARTDAAIISTFYGPAGAEFLQECGEHPGARRRATAWLIDWLQRRVLTRSQRLVVLSDYSRDQLSGILPPRMRGLISRIPAGVDSKKFAPILDMRRAREELKLPAGGTVLLSVRRLIRRNGLDCLIDAMPRVADRFPNIVLVIVGRGEIRGELEEQVKRLGLEHRVRFEGFVPDERLPVYYCAADFSVMPTRALEGFGLPILESMACGTPVIGSMCGAIPEIIHGFDPGFLLPDGLNPDDIAATICGLIERWTGRAEIRARCRSYVLELYDWDRSVELLRQVYAGEATS